MDIIKKNSFIQEMERTTLAKGKVADQFWKEAIHIVVCIHNR